MSKIKVNEISSFDGVSGIVFPNGVVGVASNLITNPKVLYFDPYQQSSGISTNTDINVVFDQQIQFSGIGTIEIRQGSISGSIVESFTCGVSAGTTISQKTLTINPSGLLAFNTSYYVVLPSVGIANTYGMYYEGTNEYFFNTKEDEIVNLFTASGGNSEFVVQSSESPTGYFKYHLFTSTGILTTTSPTGTATSLSAVLVGGGGAGGNAAPPVTTTFGGGGGAGGLIYWNSGSSFNLPGPGGPYTITIGGGGSGALPAGSNTNGTDSSIVGIGTSYTSIGGGKGGVAPTGNGSPGGSGGGGATPAGTGGDGTTNQGFPGAIATPTFTRGGGGGGAGGIGVSGGSPVNPGAGGTGFAMPEFRSEYFYFSNLSYLPATTASGIGTLGYYAGGGGGGGAPGGAGGLGGGGGGPTPSVGGNGADNTGGGGVGNDPSPGLAGNGGSGIFIIRYAIDTLLS